MSTADFYMTLPIKQLEGNTFYDYGSELVLVYCKTMKTL